jgi:hypothetical protein
MLEMGQSMMDEEEKFHRNAQMELDEQREKVKIDKKQFELDKNRQEEKLKLKQSKNK